MLRALVGGEISLRAGNLAFLTTTSLVPLTALIVSLLHALDADRMRPVVMAFVDELMAPAGRSTAVDELRRFLQGRPMRAIGGVSFALVLVSSSVLVRDLDRAINEIWAVRRRRALGISLVLYCGVLLVGPVLLAGAAVGTSNVRRLVGWLELPFSTHLLRVVMAALATVAFSLLFKLAPHAPVRWRAAVIGGAVSGVAWEAARAVFGTTAAMAFSSSPLYGSIGIAPLFLTWIYVAWAIVLGGARLAYAVEHVGLHAALPGLSEHVRGRELVGARVAALVAAEAIAGRPGPTVKSLSRRLDLSAQRIAEVVQALEEAGLVRRDRAGLIGPAREVSELTLEDVALAVGAALPEALDAELRAEPSFRAYAPFFAAADAAGRSDLRRTDWGALARVEVESIAGAP